MAKEKLPSMDIDLLTEETAAPSTAEIMSVIGREATRALCEALGGLSCALGDSNEAISNIIGRDAMNALRYHWSGGRIYIPLRIFSTDARLAEVRRLRESGMTFQAIALKMRISERHAYRMVAKTRPSGMAS